VSPLTMLVIKFQINFTTSCGNLRRVLIVPKQEELPHTKEALPASA
jgi:hypothetical protein